MKDIDMRKRIRIFINIFIAITVFVAWGYMFMDREPGALASAGIVNLKYFTVLSNIAEGLASLFWLAVCFTKKEPATADRVKYVAAVSVGLTFATIAFFLGPLYGMLSMYTGANFWFHLIVPVVAMLEFVFLSETEVGVKDNLLAVVPMLLYGAVYLLNVILRGTEGNDWYGFVNWGLPIGIVIFAVLCIATYGIGLLLRKVKPGKKTR